MIDNLADVLTTVLTPSDASTIALAGQRSICIAMAPRDALWLTGKRLASAPAASIALHSTHPWCTPGIRGSAHSAAAVLCGAAGRAEGSAACSSPVRACAVLPPTPGACTVSSMHGVRSFASSTAAEPAAASAAGGGGKKAGGSGNSGSGSGAAGAEAGWRHRMGALLLVPGSVAAFLGCWQLKRRQEKIEMLEMRRASMEVRTCPHRANVPTLGPATQRVLS